MYLLICIYSRQASEQTSGKYETDDEEDDEEDVGENGAAGARSQGALLSFGLLFALVVRSGAVSLL